MLARGLLFPCALLSACAARLPELRYQGAVSAGEVSFQLQAAPGEEEQVRRLRVSLSRALARLSRWGALRQTVVIRVLPDHRALELAVEREGYSWLRAWARYDEVLLQSPRSWGPLGATQQELDQLLLHELTHCLMYQLSATRWGWSRKQIPLWFREGMASFTAEQGYRWPSQEELARHFLAHPELDPLGRPEELYRGQSELVYGAAHHAFGFLLRRYGEEAVRALFSRMYGGASFPQAFGEVLGLSIETFLEDFTDQLFDLRPSTLRLPQGPGAAAADPSPR